MRTTMIASLVLALLPVVGDAATIDSFATNQATIADPPGVATSVSTGGTDIIGLRRDLAVLRLEGAGIASIGVAGGVATLAVADTTPDSRGEATITWDGDSDPNVLSPSGLGGVDLTVSSHSGFRVLVSTASAGTELVFTVYTDAGNASRAARRLPTIGAPTAVFVPFSSFRAIAGSGADFTSVGAIELVLRVTEGTVALDLVETAGAGLGATKIALDTLNAPIGTSPQTPGATMRYRVTVTNTGSEALDVDVEDTLGTNLSLVPASIDSSPIAREDQYATSSNVELGVVAPGLLANDGDPDGDAVTVSTIGALATALGGTVTVAADGSFTYSPPSGVGQAVDTFSYTIADVGTKTATASATIHLGPRIWFVDNGHCAPAPCGAGTLADPFGSLVQAEGASGLRDTIFLFAGSGPYPGGITLQDEQRLIGQGVALVVDGVTLVSAGAAPTITNGAGAGIALGQDNTLRGFGVGDTTTADIVGSNFGTLTVSDVELSGNGGALDLDNGTLAATFGPIEVNSGVRGIDLDAVTGSLSIAGTDIDGVSGMGIRVVNGNATHSFGATTVDAPSGISLSNNPTSTFDFSSLAVFTTAGPGLLASTSGTLNLPGIGNVIGAVGGPALDLTSTSLGAGATFSGTSSSLSTGKGINLDGVTGALSIGGGTLGSAAGIAFDLAGGTGAVSFSGSIINAASRAVEITGRTTSTVTLSGHIGDNAAGTGVNITGNSGGTITLSGNYSGNTTSSQIDIANNSGSAVINFSGSSKSLSTGANNAIDIINNGTAQIHFTGGGLVLATTSGTPFNATGGAGAITVQGIGNTLTSTTGTALHIADTTIGAAGLTFQAISSNGGTTGIVLDTTGAGPVTVTGTGAAGSGGTIQNTSGDAILLDTTGGLVTLNHMIIQDIGNMAGASNTVSGQDAIQGLEVNGGLSLTGTTIRRISDNAIHGGNHMLPAQSTVWNGLTLAGVTIEDTNRYHVTSRGDANNEGSVRIVGLRGTATVSNSTFRRGAEFLDLFVTADTLNLDVTGSVFENSYREFTAGDNSPLASVGNHCIDVTVLGAGAAGVTIGDRTLPAEANTFLNCRLGSVRVVNDAGSTGTSTFVVARNTFTVTDGSSGVSCNPTCQSADFDFPMGGVLGWNRGTGTVNTVIENNTFTDVTNASGGVGQLTLISEGGGPHQSLVQNNSFIRPGNAPMLVQSRNVAGSTVRLRAANNIVTGGPSLCTTDVSCAGGYPAPGLRTLFQANGGATMDLTLDNNEFAGHDQSYDPAETVEVHSQDAATVCTNFTNNRAEDGYSLEPTTGTMSTVGTGTCPVGAPSASCQTLLGNRGNRGGANSLATNPPFVRVVNNAVSVVGTPCATPTGGPF
jgi:uncharacterized repeat protein (TIGR01451 family)